MAGRFGNNRGVPGKVEVGSDTGNYATFPPLIRALGDLVGDRTKDGERDGTNDES